MRYELNFDEDKIIDIEAIGDDSVLDLKDCCKIMNEQQDTIFKLQDLCGKSDGENAKLRIENKMLEKEVKLLKPTNIEQYEQIQKLQKENGQLRQTMQKVCELLEEEVDLFSDEATEHDVIAYCEMQDFDNKDAYYMCVSTKKAIKMLQRCL